MITATIAGLAAGFFGMNAAADGWQPTTIIIERATKEMARFPGVYPRNPQGAAPMFYCEDGRYRARVGLDSPDFHEIIQSRTYRFRGVRAQLLIDGEKVFEDRFAYVPEFDMLTSGERKFAARIYNAIVRGQSVSIRYKGKTYPLDLPPIDSGFKSFAAACKAEGEAAKAR